MLNTALRKRGTALLDQQCWAWGRDIVRPEGNLLLEFGFERLRCPDGSNACSQYSWSSASSAAAPTHRDDGTSLHVKIWGFGLVFERRGSSQQPPNPASPSTGIYLNRYEFVPRRTADLPPFSIARELAMLPRAASCTSLLADALRWIATYEQWVLRHAGLAYRQQTYAGRSKRYTLAERVPEAWLQLANRVQTPPTRAVSSDAVRLVRRRQA